MFIREVVHKNKKNQLEYRTYKLVEAVRRERGPRQRVLLNLGADFALPKEKWKDLANRIEDILYGQQSLLPCPREIEILAGKYARKIIRRHSSVIFDRKGSDSDYTPDYQTVDMNTVENEHPRTVGSENVVYHALKELELDKKLIELGFSRPYLEAAFGVIAARLIDPVSERATHLWLQNVSGIDELMDADFSLLPQYRVYKVSDLLLKHKSEIEEHLRCKERHLFHLEEKIILYDLTNTFFEGSGKYNRKSRFGLSKEKRKDCPLVTLGLVLDAEGFAKRSQVFDGNVSEPKTLEAMIRALSCETSLLKPLIVLDAGIATEHNIDWLKGSRYPYLVVCRKRKKEMPANTELVTVNQDDRTVVQAALVTNAESGEIELYCHSTGKEKKEEGIRNAFQQRFEEELQKARTALSKKSGTKRYEKVIERVGRLKEKFKRIAHRYEVTVEKDPNTNKAAAINWHQKKTENASGVYCLRTNRKDLKEQEIWNIYNMLSNIEDAFRCMKSELGLRPVNHQKEHRVDGHLFITVLAYHISQVIRSKLRSKGIYYSWETIRTLLSTQVRTTTTMKRNDAKVIHIRKSSKAELFHKEIYDALNLPHQPGKTVRSIL